MKKLNRRAFSVLLLALFILTGNYDSCRKVSKSYSRVRGIYALSAVTG